MRTIATFGALGLFSVFNIQTASADATDDLYAQLKQYGFTGRIEEQLTQKLGRTLDPKKVELGRLVFFDKGLGLHKTNSCAGCHAPSRGFGDTQPIAIGIGKSSDVVGPSRKGERNQRRTPMLLNIGFFPALMWNGRFSSASNDPFDNSQGFSFPIPESRSFFPAKDPRFPHLLVAQAHIPFTETPEMAGFGGFNSKPASGPLVFSAFNSQRFSTVRVAPPIPAVQGLPGQIRTFSLPITQIPGDRPIRDEDTKDGPSDFRQFDDLPATDTSRFIPESYNEVPSRNNPIRHKVLERINSFAAYRDWFGQIFPAVNDGNAIEFYMVGQVLSEFQLALTFANAPIDKFARGDRNALTERQKVGGTIFFGRGQCVACHSVSGSANEMFSDFKMHAAGVPSIAPVFGAGTGNVPFRDQSGSFTIKGLYDMGLFDITGLEADRFKFRTSPLRNVGLQANFFHNGAFNKLENAVRYHLDATANAPGYKPENEGVPQDLRQRPGANDVVLEHLAPQLKNPVKLSDPELDALVDFLNAGLLDERAKPDRLKALIPAAVPSGEPVQRFE